MLPGWRLGRVSPSELREPFECFWTVRFTPTLMAGVPKARHGEGLEVRLTGVGDHQERPEAEQPHDARCGMSLR